MSEAEEYFREKTKNNICQPDLEKDKVHYESLISFATDFHADQVHKHNLVDGVEFPNWLNDNYYLVSVDFKDIVSMTNKVNEFRRYLTNLANEVQDKN